MLIQTLRSHWKESLGLLVLLVAAPALAQSSNFGRISLSPGFSNAEGRATGYIRGSFSLPSIANRDQDGNFCLGYGDANPDHILVLQDDFSRLTVQVDSGGNDTTLLIQGPDTSTVRCGDNSGRSKDASIQDTEWSAGTYSVWVGSFERGRRYDYTLSIQEN